MMASVAHVPEIGASRAALRSRSLSWVWPVSAAAVTSIVTLWGLTRSSITLVETATVTASTRPLSEFPALLRKTDAVLAPYYVFMHFWLRLGHSLWWMRLPGVVACAATAALLVIIGRRWSLRIGVLAGLFFAISADTSRYAEDTRPYAFAMLMATLATWRLLIATENPRRRSWMWYGVTVVLIGITHLFALLVLPAHAWFARRHIKEWLGSVAVALVLLAPLLAYGQAQVSNELSWAEKPGVHALRALLGELTGSAGLTVVLGLLCLVGMVHLWSDDRDWGALLVLWVVLPPVLLFAVSQVHAVFASRYLAFVVPAISLLAAAGLSSLRRPLAIVAAGLVLALLVPAQLDLRRSAGHDGNDLAFMAQQLTKLVQPIDGIVYEPTTARRLFEGYAKPPPGQDLLQLASPEASNTLTGTNVPASVAAQRLGAVTRVWVVRVTDRNIATSPIYGFVNTELQRFHQQQKIPMKGGSITLYVRPG